MCWQRGASDPAITLTGNVANNAPVCSQVADGVVVLDGTGHPAAGVYRQFGQAVHQTCLAHLLRRCREMTRGEEREGSRFPVRYKASDSAFSKLAASRIGRCSCCWSASSVPLDQGC